MQPITTTLLTALVAGATAAAGEVVGQAIHDAYTGLKQLVIDKLGGKAEVTHAVQQVEADPKSKGRQLMLQEELAKAAAADPAAAQDALLLAKAQALLKLLAAQGQPTSAAVQITQTGSGAIAYGPGAKAAGERGVVADVIHGLVSTGDHARQMQIGSSRATPDIQDDPIGQSPALQALRALLSNLYDTEADARRVAQESGIATTQVNFSTKAVNLWHNLLVEAHRQEKVKALIATAGFEYPASADALRQAYQEYVRSQSGL